MTLDLEAARVNLSDLSAVESLFRELEFRTLGIRLRSLDAIYSGQQAPGTAPVPASSTRPATPGSQLSLFGEEITRIGISPTYELETKIVELA